MKKKNPIVAVAVAVGIFVGAPGVRAAEEAKPYVLDTCIVSDEKLGSMGAPVVEVYEGQELKLCCKHCIGDFKKDPAALLEKYQAAVASKSSGAASATP